MALLVAAGGALLSLDQPVTRRHNSRTKNACVGSDVTYISARVAAYPPSTASGRQPAGAARPAHRPDRDRRLPPLTRAQANLLSARPQDIATCARQQKLQAQIGQSAGTYVRSEEIRCGMLLPVAEQPRHEADAATRPFPPGRYDGQSGPPEFSAIRAYIPHQAYSIAGGCPGGWAWSKTTQA